MKTKKQKQDEIDEVLSQTEEGDILEVHFIDSCRCRNVRKLSNKAFATYKKMIGRFWTIKVDKLYGEEFLILWDTLTDFEKRDIVSIPLAVIQKISLYEEEKNLRTKVMSSVGMPILAGGWAKPEFRENGIGEVVETQEEEEENEDDNEG